MTCTLWASSYKGAIHEHFVDTHGDRPTVDLLLNNTKIINRTSSKAQLYIAEAVAIEIRKPKLNIQQEFDYTLPSNRKQTRTARTDASNATTNPTEGVGNEETAVVPTPETSETANGGEEPIGNILTRPGLRPLLHRLQRATGDGV